MDPRSRNINIVQLAEVYVADDDAATVFNDGELDPASWSFVGLLSGGSSIGQEMEVTREDITSWGGVAQITSAKFVKDVRSFTALESNDVTFGLIWGVEGKPEGTPTALKAPETNASRKVAFKTENSFGDVEIFVSRRAADVYPSSMEKGDEGASVTEFTVDVFKDDLGALYDYLFIRGAEQGESEPVEQISFVDAPVDPEEG